MAKKCLWLALLAALAANTGCCKWCDRVCGNQHCGGYTPAPACAPAPQCAPACQPVQCYPAPAAAPACVPVGSSPAAGWQRNPGCP
jgi:hypothetical protein